MSRLVVVAVADPVYKTCQSSLVNGAGCAGSRRPIQQSHTSCFRVGSPHGLPGEIGTDGESLVRSAVWQGSLDPHAYLAAPTVTRRAVEWNVALEEALRLEDVSVQIFADLQVQQVEPRRDGAAGQRRGRVHRRTARSRWPAPQPGPMSWVWAPAAAAAWASAESRAPPGAVALVRAYLPGPRRPQVVWQSSSQARRRCRSRACESPRPERDTEPARIGATAGGRPAPPNDGPLAPWDASVRAAASAGPAAGRTTSS